MCVRGDQQVEGEDYFQQDLYVPTLKATEARLIAAIAAQYGAKLIKTDCKQAFLYGDMDDGPPIYISRCLIGGQNQSLMATHSYCARVSMERSRRCASGIVECQGG